MAISKRRSPRRRAANSGVIRLVTTQYLPVPDDRLSIAEEMIRDLRSGELTGFVMVVVGPETAGGICGFSGGRMDRIQLMGQLTMALRSLQDQELEIS